MTISESEIQTRSSTAAVESDLTVDKVELLDSSKEMGFKNLFIQRMSPFVFPFV